MKRFLSFSLAVFCCFCLMIATEPRAHAYIDPGTGLLALQSFFAGLAAFGYMMRRRIAALFGRDKSPKNVVMASTTVQNEKERNAA
ncbi:hypothetical protein [Granulicella paludicola]|jgi:hypothetical protein|uniref:hypothetical protein n=1 Tax=Granulicella paludicola TaxID=474951 RepID=UPI0021E092DC|nr:hypothetical protein [Granulicella paludicola]